MIKYKKIWIFFLVCCISITTSGCMKDRESGNETSTQIKTQESSSIEEETNTKSSLNENTTEENSTTVNENEESTEDALDKAVKQLEELNDILNGKGE